MATDLRSCVLDPLSESVKIYVLPEVILAFVIMVNSHITPFVVHALFVLSNMMSEFN